MARPAGGYAKDGKKILGSTSVLKYLQFMDGDILCNWAARLAREGKDWKKVRSEAGAHGSMMHDLCEFGLPNALTDEDRPRQLVLPPPLKNPSASTTKAREEKQAAVDAQWEKLKLSYGAVREWFLAYEPRVVFHEEPLYSDEYGFAGTPDGVAIFPRDIEPSPVTPWLPAGIRIVAGDHWLYDYKTGGMVGAKEICQMASYRQLLAETRGIHVKGAILIHVPTKEPGYMRPVVLPPAALDMGWDAFLCGLRVSKVAGPLAAYTEA